MKIYTFIILLCSSLYLNAGVIHIDGQAFSSKTLLKHKDIQDLKVVDPTYKKEISFKALPLKKIIKDPKENQSVEFKALDGFSSTIPAKTLFFQKSVPYLAIENPRAKWPLRSNNKNTAGPFYLIWEVKNNERIGQEQWPFQIKTITTQKSITEMYPKLHSVTMSDAAQKGFNVFVKSCFSCHKLSGYGEADMGPDLQNPMSPVDYFKPGILRKFIRNPKSVRAWKDMQMPGFSKEEITELELDQLLAYLIEIRLLLK